MRMSRPRFRLRSPHLLATAAVAAALLLAGCGSSGSPAAAGAGTGSGAASGAGSATAVSTAIPSQDVVSGIAVDPAIKAELPASVQSSGVLTYGTFLQPGTEGLPHEGQVNGQYVGVDIDLRDAVGKVLGINWNVQNTTFATIIPGVQNGKYDVGAGNFGVTAAREKVVDYATYLTDGQAVLGSTTVPLSKVSSITDLCGLIIATSPGSTFQQILGQDASQCAAAGKKPWTVQYYSDSAPIYLGLQNGKIDVFFGPTLSLQYDAAHIAGTKFLGQLSSTPVGWVTAKGSPLTKPISDAINELISNGDYAKILAKWGVTSSGIPKSEINPPANL